MAGINPRKFFLTLLCTGCIGATCSPGVRAADCNLLLQDLSRLKGMMQRQELLTRAIRECPDDYQINYYYGYHLERLRRYDQALHYYGAAIRLQPDFAKGYFGMGDVYLAQGKSRPAVDAFRKGLRLEPDNIWAQRSYQQALQQEKPGAQLPFAKAGGEGKSPESAPESPVAEKEAAPVVPAPVAVQAKESAERDTAAPMTAEGFVQSMTEKRAQSGSGDQEHMLSMQIQFKFSSGDLTDEAKEELDNVVCKALQNPKLRGRRFEVAGHTDDSGTPEMNMFFSKIRAMEVRDYLIKQCGIAPDRLTVVYYGQERPAFPNTSRKNRILNRRVEFRLLP